MPNNLFADEEKDEVYYCLSCHSLNIQHNPMLADDDWDGSFCGRCSSTNIGVCTMTEWLAEEERRKKKREEIEWMK